MSDKIVKAPFCKCEPVKEETEEKPTSILGKIKKAKTGVIAYLSATKYECKSESKIPVKSNDDDNNFF